MEAFCGRRKKLSITRPASGCDAGKFIFLSVVRGPWSVALQTMRFAERKPRTTDQGPLTIANSFPLDSAAPLSYRFLNMFDTITAEISTASEKLAHLRRFL
ncbi:MAG TPA: hypothetical protein VFB27_11450 [Opitutaceae bacterium]|nr:hypothetical protein [Opitutaceae bacterium]